MLLLILSTLLHCVLSLFMQVFSEVHKEENCDGLSTEDFRYAISRSPDFSMYDFLQCSHTHRYVQSV